LAALCRRQWEKWGRTPRALFADLTPSQFVGLLTTQLNSTGFDRVAELTKFNDLRGKRGEQPVVPAWLSD
jgi:hypothetical protein